MSKELILHKTTPDINMFGLRKGQVLLYQYILECTKENKVVDMDRIYIIYYTHVAITCKHYAGDYRWVRIKGTEYYDIKMKEFKSGKITSLFYSFENCHMWMKGVIGSLVIRGLLGVVPKFDPEIQKQIA